MRINLSNIKDLKNHRNYNRTAIEDRWQEPEAYRANIIRIIRHLIHPKKRGSTKLGFNIINNRSDIRSKSKAAARL
jgi:hypothetical protein